MLTALRICSYSVGSDLGLFDPLMLTALCVLSYSVNREFCPVESQILTAHSVVAVAGRIPACVLLTTVFLPNRTLRSSVASDLCRFGNCMLTALCVVAVTRWIPTSSPSASRRRCAPAMAPSAPRQIPEPYPSSPPCPDPTCEPPPKGDDDERICTSV